jgi:hypothetical protein
VNCGHYNITAMNLYKILYSKIDKEKPCRKRTEARISLKNYIIDLMNNNAISKKKF